MLFLVFNEGYLATGADSDPVRHDLTAEAIRLTRLIQSLMQEDGEVAGLLALMLLTEACRAARVSAKGEAYGGCGMERDIANKNLFMMCTAPNPHAFTELSYEYHVRACRRSEIAIWKAIHFDDPQVAKDLSGFMDDYFNDVYADKEDLFYEKCLFICGKNDIPIATCFGWKSYEQINTIHWFKVLKRYEGLGIGRSLLSIVMKSFVDDDYPVYLHTQPTSFRAIKLYSDFGFAFLGTQ